MRIRIPFGRARWRPEEAVDAYLDGALATDERARLERDLERRPELQAMLEEHRVARQVLRDLPGDLDPPRSFRLTPAMVAAPVPAVRRAHPALRTGAQALAGVSAVVLVGALTLGSLGGSVGGDDDGGALRLSETNESAAGAAAEKAAPTAANADAPATATASIATPAPTVPRPAGGGVSGQVAPSPEPATPAPPATGAGSPGDEPPTGGEGEAPATGETGDTAALTFDSNFAPPGDDGDSGLAGSTIVALAAAALLGCGIAGAVVFRRRE
ncbi:MAG: anti-sigma factor family protein [Dehalococcoidia bacterium]